MKIKDIIVREADETQAKITKVNPDKTVEITPIGGGKPFNVPMANLTQTQQGQFQAPNPQPSVGTDITLISNPTGQLPTSTPSTSTSTSTTPTPSPADQMSGEIKVAEVSDEDLNNLEELSDSDLIALARDNGIEDSVNRDDQGNLTNRDELIDLLQSGSDIGGDQTDDFIDDVEDQEYGQMMERIKQLSGLKCV